MTSAEVHGYSPCLPAATVAALCLKTLSLQTDCSEKQTKLLVNLCSLVCR
jgi:hypothetical protein